MIVIIGSMQYDQINRMVAKISNITSEFEVVDFQNCKDISIGGPDGAGKYNLMVNGRDLSSSKVVLFDPKYLVHQFGDTQEWAEDLVTQRNWRAVNENLLHILPGKKLNDPASVQNALPKLVQLASAVRCGLKVPETLVDNVTARIVTLAEQGFDLVTKALGDPTIPYFKDGLTQRILMTSPVEPETLQKSEALQMFPVLVQRNIEKRFEYRVVVVRDRVFAFRIDPNKHPLMATDYRRGGYMVEYDRVILPKIIEEQLLKLHGEFGLFSASYDLIEDPTGEFIFLEVNPAGVWGYIDDLNGGIISDAFAEEVCNELTRSVSDSGQPVAA